MSLWTSTNSSSFLIKTNSEFSKILLKSFNDKASPRLLFFIITFSPFLINIVFLFWIILDRIIGFRLSKLMQAKTDGTSAGRVQSVALKLVVDKEREIE